MEYNGLEIGNQSTKIQGIIFETMAVNANLRYWSPDALEQLYIGTAAMIEEIKPDKRFTSSIKKIKGTCNNIWGIILKSEKKGLLNGFHISNHLGSRIYGNPEINSIVEIK